MTTTSKTDRELLQMTDEEIEQWIDQLEKEIDSEPVDPMLRRIAAAVGVLVFGWLAIGGWLIAFDQGGIVNEGSVVVLPVVVLFIGGVSALTYFAIACLWQMIRPE